MRRCICFQGTFGAVAFVVVSSLFGCSAGSAGNARQVPVANPKPALAPLGAAPPPPADPGHSDRDEIIAHALRAELNAHEGLAPWLVVLDVRNGIVTLTGSSETLAAKEDVRAIARRVEGVRAVVDRLELVEERRADEDVALDVEYALSADPALSLLDVSVTADDGRVQLAGTIESELQRRLAARAARQVPGVRSVDTTGLFVALVHPRPDDRIRAEVLARLRSDASVGSDRVKVHVRDGVVTLSGKVRCAGDRAELRRRAWVRGVRDVRIGDLGVEWWNDDVTFAREGVRPGDAEIASAVSDALRADPRLFGPLPIVRVSHGVVTLTGAVPSLAAKRAAADDARSALGVRAVENALAVRPRRAHDDDALRSRALHLLTQSRGVDASALDVSVAGGRLRLHGTLSSPRELDRAVALLRSIPGVTGVTSEVVVAGGRDVLRDDHALRAAIERRLWANPFVDARKINVDVTRGVVTLTGRVEDALGRATALRVARSVWPDRVVDQLSVNPGAASDAVGAARVDARLH